MSDNPPLVLAHLYDRVRDLLARASALAVADGAIAAAVLPEDIVIERPREAKHGDLATNLCFALAKAAKTNPRALADKFCAFVRQADTAQLVESLEVAGPGFVNLRLTAHGWQTALHDVLRADQAYGQTATGGGQRVHLEFVSANPTGPMHVGHGRGAVLGDALAAVLRAAGYAVDTEYYINNVGNQISKLGESVWHWLRAADKRAAALQVWAAGDPVAFPEGFPVGFPEDGYRGAYVAEAAELLAADPALGPCQTVATWSDAQAWQGLEPSNLSGRADNRAVSVASWRAMLQRIETDLAAIGVRFDRFFSERSLHGLDGGKDEVQACAQRLLAADWAYAEAAAEADEDSETAPASAAPTTGRALFFRGTREDVPKPFRDGKDRVIVRGDGRPTYFAADIAYHDNKLGRGYDHLINILGADHHGYVPRLKGVIHALGDMRRSEGDPKAARWNGERLEVPLVQMVALLRDGKPVPMGKRSGEFVTLRDVIDEVTTPGNPQSGRDAVRFLFLLRKADAQVDFDLEVARRASMDNPVYYVQYGHARLASILARAQAQGTPLRHDQALAGQHLAALQLDDERAMALMLAEYPEVVARAARGREPHQVAYYLLELCRAWNGYYSRHKQDARVISSDDATTQARLALVAAIKRVVGGGLQLLGVGAPERMASLGDDAPDLDV